MSGITEKVRTTTVNATPKTRTNLSLVVRGIEPAEMVMGAIHTMRNIPGKSGHPNRVIIAKTTSQRATVNRTLFAAIRRKSFVLCIPELVSLYT
jgi:hypothetical protein